jgi:hypothetical protein
MVETNNREDLTPKDRALFEEILANGPADMSDGDKEVIRSRRSYLTSLEKEIFKGVLTEKKEEKKEVVADVAGEKTLLDHTVAELKAICEKRGIAIPDEAKKKADIVALIEGFGE